jgi:hypothetical protein
VKVSGGGSERARGPNRAKTTSLVPWPRRTAQQCRVDEGCSIMKLEKGDKKRRWKKKIKGKF